MTRGGIIPAASSTVSRCCRRQRLLTGNSAAESRADRSIAPQMWVNLPRSHKMTPPKYQDIPAEKIPIVEPAAGVSAKIIAGECAGRKAVVQTVLPVQYIDFIVQPGASFAHIIPGAAATSPRKLAKPSVSRHGTTHAPLTHSRSISL